MTTNQHLQELIIINEEYAWSLCRLYIFNILVCVLHTLSFFHRKKPTILTLWNHFVNNEGVILVNLLHEQPLILASRIKFLLWWYQCVSLAMLFSRTEIYIIKFIVQSNVGLSLSTKGASSILISAFLKYMHYVLGKLALLFLNNIYITN